MKTSYENDKEANRWNHRPNGPVTLNPLFDWPPRFFAVFRWYSAYWLAASTTTACVLRNCDFTIVRAYAKASVGLDNSSMAC